MSDLLSELRRQLLPSPPQTLIARVCLAAPPAAQAAWGEWIESNPNPVTALAHPRSGARRLLPLLHRAVSQQDLPAPREVKTYLRTAALRDELRYENFRKTARLALQALVAAGVEPVALKGAALAESYYPHPSLRHSHDLDLLVRESDFGRATECLERAGWRRRSTIAAARHHHRSLVHPGGLAVCLHSRLLRLPHLGPRPEEIDAVTIRGDAFGVAVRKFNPQASLAAVCAQAGCHPSRITLNWISDAFFLLAGNPAFDWSTCVRYVREWQVSLPAAITVRYLADALGAPVPQDVCRDLDVSAGQVQDKAACELAWFCAQSGALAHLRAFLLTPTPGARALLAHELIWPSDDFARWACPHLTPLPLPVVKILLLAQRGGSVVWRACRAPSRRQVDPIR